MSTGTALTMACEQPFLLLQGERQRLAHFSLRAALQQDAQRVQRYALQVGDLYADFSRHLIDDAALSQLEAHGRSVGMAQALDHLQAGRQVNPSEKQAAHHLASRDLGAVTADAAARGVIEAQRRQLFHLLAALRRGDIRGARGATIDTLVNIGVGGSDLGAAMAVEALQSFAQAPFKVHFISSIDGVAIHDLLTRIDVDRSLFIMASKSFTTADAWANLQTVQEALVARGYREEECRRHIAGISAHPERMRAAGIPEDLQLHILPTIGGRFSLSSNMGLVLAARLGEAGFMDFLAGMHAMDRHTLALAERSMPGRMALLTWWYAEFWQARAQAILPYHQRLAHLPRYLAQLEMESLGKACDGSGQALQHAGQVVFGDVGSNAQHAFMQLLHQGTHCIPADIIAFVNLPESNRRHADLNLANALAQGRALALGYTLSEAQQEFPDEGEASWRCRVHPGNRPSTTLLAPCLDAYHLGSLIALYEHKTFLLAQLWRVNPFDQMGVELGKRLAKPLIGLLAGQRQEMALDASTAALLTQIAAYRR